MLSTKVREKSIGKMKSMRFLAVFMFIVVTLIMGVAAPQVWAWGFDYACVEELDEAEVFFEFNSTDCDVGIQFFWDGVAWKWMIVKDKHGRAVLDVFPLRNVRAVGLTEAHFEGNEPQLTVGEEECEGAEEAIQAFLEQYKDGPYTFKGMSIEGCWLEGSSELSYELPEAPVINSPDPEDPDLEDFLDNPTITWALDSSVEEYEVVIEVEFDGSTLVDTATLPGRSTQYTASPTFIGLIRRINNAGLLEVLKFEVIAINANKTITEVVVFELEEE